MPGYTAASSTSHYAKSTNPLEPIVPTGESPPPSAPPSSLPAVLFTPAESKIESKIESKMTDRCGFADAPRAAEFYNLFRSKDARANLSRIWHGKRGRSIWALMIEALNAGLITENDRSFRTASLLLLFPSLPSTGNYDLENPEHLGFVRDCVLPAIIACRDELLANPERTEEIVKEYFSRQESTETTESTEGEETTENEETTETTDKNRTEDELRIARMNDLNALLMSILKIDDQFTRKYGYWRRWQVSEHSVDRLRRAIAFLAELVPNSSDETIEAKIGNNNNHNNQDHHHQEG